MLKLSRSVSHIIASCLVKLRKLKPGFVFALILFGVLHLEARPAQAQADPQQLMEQMTSLLQQMQSAKDPCPYMQRMKSLVAQFAASNPQVYQAMKPSIDAMVQEDDSCSASPPASAQPPGQGSGTAAPPTCVDLGGSVGCVTQAQYQQMQAQKQQQAAQMQVCPASGFVPGPGHYEACDAYVGERIYCTRGQSIPTYKPAPPPAGCGGQSTNSHHLVSPDNLNRCVSLDYNGKTPLSTTGWDRYTDNCGVPVNVTVLFGNGVGGASGMDIDAGRSAGTGNSAQDYARQGGGHYYTCPGGYGAADMQGNYLTVSVTEYVCREHGY